MNKILYVDMDDTIISCFEKIRELAVELHGVTVPKDDNSWNCGLTSKQIDRIFADWSMYTYDIIIDGCIDALTKAKGRGYKIILVSSCGRSNAINKLLFVKDYLEDIIDDFVMVGLSIPKSNLDMSNGILIDDSIANLSGKGYKILCKCAGDKLWNRDYKGSMTMKHWNELSGLLDRIEAYELNVMR